MSENGTDSFVSGMLLNLLLILGGTVAVVYLSSLTIADREAIYDHFFRVSTILLAQPGVFWTVRILTNQQIPLKKRCVCGLVVFLGFAMALPVIFGSMIEESFNNVKIFK